MWTLSSPSDLTTPGRIGVAYMTDQVNTNVTDGKIMTDYSAGDFHCILLASNFSDLGCEFGVLIVTSPRLPGTVWVGQIWEYKFNAWYKMPTATPPQEYDMSLSEGATGTCKYSMDQFGIVRITGQISLSAATGITYIGTLPEGYRPGSYEVKSTCGWQTGGVNPVPCTCGADPDGRVWVNSYGAAIDAAAIDIRFVNLLS